ncbi:MAG: carboxylating nicotinate-nucleotide diphosphorylase [Ruminococcus sp.]|jgi:nicotinate-nucleotide pyrophosphorylase (carboxylating)|nr:carboxylating nicotinate-nucleotide diphosphorylase [Ruminococcus sp.]
MVLPILYVDDLIKRALFEDINYIDLATDNLIDENAVSTAVFVAKADGIVCGIEIALRVFETLDRDIAAKIFKKDGETVIVGEIIAEVCGKTRAILKSERVSLNILQHMSGIATAVNVYQKLCAGTKCHICETRKTLPGLRSIEKYAVLCGGGRNHRFNLSDAAMLKDNHIDAYGSLTAAVTALRGKIGHMNKIEVEVRTKEELREALECGCDVIMLDNMTTEEMRECVLINDGKALLEASGNVTAERVKEIAAAGVDVISSGALTHSAYVLDISLKIK